MLRKRSGIIDNVVTKNDRGMRRWFAHIKELLLIFRIIKYINNFCHFRTSRVGYDQIKNVLIKGLFRNTKNRCTCVKRCMNVEQVNIVSRICMYI